jgi:hypothetical protein
VRGKKFAKHERLRFAAFMAYVQKRCKESGTGGVLHRVPLGDGKTWEAAYRPGEKRPHHLTIYKDSGAIRFVYMNRELGKNK